ncbi:PREDICTED: uncharacterized protein LOC105135525 [Populus euphratica]|uniref:Uncharacterized protein LOC105135525 n=1 Tax=Populus euphratica TaxID=75702 RepID=A0AAJ6UYZ0_POPEU|nr:PREDICTED: uncharacterized protein LOC105135525 [Populus euphratica]
MQDLGVCEDIVFHDDFNIPDVDKRICNFEELFGGDLDPIGAFPDENDLPCSSVEKDMSLEKSNNRDGRAVKGSILKYVHWKSLTLKRRKGLECTTNKFDVLLGSLSVMYGSEEMVDK